MSNLLSEVHPELVLEWSERNLPLTPDKITYGSRVRSQSNGEEGNQNNHWRVESGDPAIQSDVHFLKRIYPVGENSL